jgi:hypothetical protein
MCSNLKTNISAAGTLCDTAMSLCDIFDGRTFKKRPKARYGHIAVFYWPVLIYGIVAAAPIANLSAKMTHFSSVNASSIQVAKAGAPNTMMIILRPNQLDKSPPNREPTQQPRRKRVAERKQDCLFTQDLKLKRM